MTKSGEQAVQKGLGAPLFSHWEHPGGQVRQVGVDALELALKNPRSHESQRSPEQRHPSGQAAADQRVRTTTRICSDCIKLL